MPSYHSGVTCKDKWKVTKKITESGDSESEEDVKETGVDSSCRGVFLCSKLDDPRQEAVVKIRMQVPWRKTIHRPAHVRAKQAVSGVLWITEAEVKNLQRLTSARCSCTPALFAWKHEIQSRDGWVPGGYIDYILMERIPGSMPLLGFGDENRPERDELREAFKKAWLEITACGVEHGDPANRNLVWDRKTQKCYIVDWETAWEIPKDTAWSDTNYIAWNLAWTQSHDYEDMSTWYL